MSKLAKDIVKTAVDVCLGKYGNTEYCNTPGDNIMVWHADLNAWRADCLGFVHTMVNGFRGDKNRPGGGAILDDFVLCSDERRTLYEFCHDISGDFSGLIPCELLQTPTHVGLFVGELSPFSDGRVFNTAECTPAFGGGCILTYTDIYGNRFNHKGGTQRGNWSKRGKFNDVIYDEVSPVIPDVVTAPEILEICQDVLKNRYGVYPEREKIITELYGAKTYRKVQDIINILYRV